MSIHTGTPTWLSLVSVRSLDNVYSVCPMTLLSFHRSMRANCFTSTALDLLTYFWPLRICFCVFTSVFHRTTCLFPTGHCLVQDFPFLLTYHQLPFHIYILYLYQSCHSSVWLHIFNWSIWRQSFILSSCSLVMISHRPMWRPNVQSICWSMYMRTLYVMTSCLSLKTSVQSFVYSLVLYFLLF